MKITISHLRRSAILLVAAATSVSAQTIRTRTPAWVGTPLDEYIRLMQLTGEVPLSSRMLRPLEAESRGLALSDSSPLSRNPWRRWYGSRQRGDTGRFTVEFYDPFVRLADNTAAPYGGNDGAMWAGRGISGSVEMGAALRYGPLTLRLAPTATASQNADFKLGALHKQYTNGVVSNTVPLDMSIYADPYMSYKIDMPQRYGDESLRDLNWGQSAIRLERFGVQAAISNENMWWGPGHENALLMTNNAAGIPHLSLGTSRPANIYIGKLEALYSAGTLRTSNYWRQTAPDSLRNRWINGLSIVIEPRGAPGLYIGATRVFYFGDPQAGISAKELLEILQPFTKVAFITDSNRTGNDRRDQLVSFMFRWVLPSSNFEVYGELGRNDHPVDNRDLILEPDHGTAYVIGLQKLFLLGGGFVRLRAEATDLAGNLTRVVRTEPTWYAHSIITPGYTQTGQVVGASVGPGGESKTLRIDRLGSSWSLGGSLKWQRVNTDAYFREHYGQFQRIYHDAYLGAGIQGSWVTKFGNYSAEVLRLREFNRYWIRRNDLLNYNIRLSSELRVF